MEFCTSVSCIDGRIQEAIQTHLKTKHGFKFVNTITEPGVCRILSEKSPKRVVQSIISKIELSIEAHRSRTIVISGHHDCVANPVDKNAQVSQLHRSKELLANSFPSQSILTIYINENWEAEDLLTFQ